MAEHKKQHFLPESYLRGFSTLRKFSNVEQYVLWKYELTSKELKMRSPRKIAWRPYLYSFRNVEGNFEHTLEEKLSQIEKQAKDVFNKIDEDAERISNKQVLKNRIYPNDKIILITFAFLMMKRIPKIMDKIYEGVNTIAEDIVDKYDVLIPEGIRKKESLQMFLEIGLSKEYNILEKLMGKNIAICYIPNEVTSFITTDNPFVTWRRGGKPAGIAYDDTEIYLPINHRCFLILHGKGSRIDFIRYSNRKQIRSLNKYMAKHATEFIVCKEQKLIEKIIQELTWGIRK